MSYEYGDRLLKLIVNGGYGGAHVGIRYEPVDDFGNVGYTKTVPPEEAPALALAILEAAGYGKTEAAGFVRGQVEALAKQVEREAEDAKVVEFHTAIGANLNRIERHHRDLYNAARKFFEES